MIIINNLKNKCEMKLKEVKSVLRSPEVAKRKGASRREAMAELAQIIDFYV